MKTVQDELSKRGYDTHAYMLGLAYNDLCKKMTTGLTLPQLSENMAKCAKALELETILQKPVSKQIGKEEQKKTEVFDSSSKGTHYAPTVIDWNKLVIYTPCPTSAFPFVPHNSSDVERMEEDMAQNKSNQSKILKGNVREYFEGVFGAKISDNDVNLIYEQVRDAENHIKEIDDMMKGNVNLQRIIEKLGENSADKTLSMDTIMDKMVVSASSDKEHNKILGTVILYVAGAYLKSKGYNVKKSGDNKKIYFEKGE
jgi:hypothetical protein